MKLLLEIPYEPAGIAINATPLLIGDSVVVVSAGREVWLLEQATGKILWKYLLAKPTNIQTDVFATDGVRIIATHVQDVRAWYISTGEIAWIRDLPEARGTFVDDQLVYYDGKVYAGGYHKAYCLDAQSGNIIWANEIMPIGSVSGASVSKIGIIMGGFMGITDNSGRQISIGKIFALSPNTGDTLWSNQVKGEGSVSKAP